MNSLAAFRLRHQKGERAENSSGMTLFRRKTPACRNFNLSNPDMRRLPRPLDFLANVIT
jgi:hypothetical protein